MSNGIHSNAFIDMLEEVLKLDLSLCYQAVITANIREPLEIELHTRGTIEVVDGFRMFASDIVKDDPDVVISIVNDE